MMTKPYHITWLDRWQARIERRLQLARGRWVQMRGAQVGARFGLGYRVQILYPSWLQVGEDVTIDDYTYLHCLSKKGVFIGDRTSLGRSVWLHNGCTLEKGLHGYFHIGHDSFLGCNAVVGSSGGVHIGNHVQIGPNLLISSENHVFKDNSRRIDEQGVDHEAVEIQDNCWIGSNVTILAGVTVATGSVIAAGAVVTKSLPSNSVIAGIPAKAIKYRE
jgi:acetyltransferase-like isoleucine patch superfamily enzyme